MPDKPSMETFETGEGARIFRIPLEAFLGLWTYVHLVLFGPYRVLIDTGSGYGESNEHLEAGFREASLWNGRGAADGEITFESLTHIFITHGHIDHFGGLSYVRPRTQAQLGIHELDCRNLTHYEERLTMVALQLERFLIEAGVSSERLERLLNLYKITKGLFRSVNVDFTYEACGMRLGPFDFLHVPGHCAGHVAIRLHDVLFSGDHVLEGISPHQAPERLTLSTGLGHYLKSLDELQRWAGQPRLTLGGHKQPISNLPARLDAIREVHAERLGEVMAYLSEPRTVVEISRRLFGAVSGYNVLLAIEEAGAHVEYLYQRGLLGIENLAELESHHAPVPIHYVRYG